MVQRRLPFYVRRYNVVRGVSDADNYGRTLPNRRIVCFSESVFGYIEQDGEITKPVEIELVLSDYPKLFEKDCDDCDKKQRERNRD
jgi:hypothetical protein